MKFHPFMVALFYLVMLFLSYPIFKNINNYNLFCLNAPVEHKKEL